MDTFDLILRIVQIISNLLLAVVLWLNVKEMRADREEEEEADE